MDRAAVDPDFRQLCLEDPHSAISEVASRDIPAGVKLRFIEKEGYDMTLVLPPAAGPDGELSDDELEEVAGGGRCGGSCAASCLFSAVQ